MLLTRRKAVELLAAGALGGCVETLPDSDLTPKPGTPLLDEARLPDQQAVWSWVETLNGFGPRLTGSPAQARFVDFCAAELERAGLPVLRDARSMRRWQAKHCALSVSGAWLPVASPFPYSGRTPDEGVTGELVWFAGPPLSFARAAGKIAVVEVIAEPISPLLLQLVAKNIAALPADANLTDSERTPLIGGLIATVDLGQAAADGVLGVLCVWRGCAEDDVRNQYLPFTTPFAGCPSVWVGPLAGDTLRAASLRGGKATLILQADLDDDVRTDTIYAVLPGTDANETILVNTHSDGPNAAEENGAVGLLALAHYFASLPRASRRRTLVFVIATGHFQLPQLGDGGQATKAWLDRHPEWWDGVAGHRRAVAGLTLEHLGCLEWKESEDGIRFGPTGRLEREIVYTTNPTMRRVYLDAVAGRTKIRSLLVEPHNGIFFGEAEPLFNAGIPSISLCPLPNYLCAAPADGGIGRLDPDFMHQQIATFAKALVQLDALPASAIGPARPDPTAFIGRTLKAVMGA